MNIQIDHWQTVQTMMRGYRPAHVIISCAQLDIFHQLGEQRLSAAQLAGRSGSDASALARLLNAAVALGLLDKSDEGYANAPLALSCLADPDAEYYLGNLIRREGAFYQRWSYLTEAVRSGKRPEANIRDEGQRDWVLDFEMALYDIARPLAPIIAERLALPATRTLRILDVGGGHGGYSMALARRYPQAQLTVFELPAAAAVARSLIAAEGLAERVAVQVGDFQQQGLGADFDLILLFGVLVSETPSQKKALLRKAYQALAPGGTVAIRSFCLDADRAGPLDATLFSLHMLLSTEAGDIGTRADLQQYLRESGFSDVRELPLSPQSASPLLLATK